MSFEKKLQELILKHSEMEKKMGDPAALGGKEFARVSKEYSDLTPIVENIHAFDKAKQSAAEAEAIIADPSMEKDMKEMAEEELRELKKTLPQIEQTLKVSLLPKDEADEKNAILEVRAGTGG